MKRLVLKKWFAYLLVTINMCAFCVMASEVEDLSLFMTSHLIALLVFAGNSMLIIKYCRKEWLDD